MKDPKNIP